MSGKTKPQNKNNFGGTPPAQHVDVSHSSRGNLPFGLRTFRLVCLDLHRIRFSQKSSRRLWRSRRRKSSSVPAGAANFPAAAFLAGKCPNLGRDSILRCRKIGESFSSSVEICRKTFPAGNFGQPQPSRVF